MCVRVGTPRHVWAVGLGLLGLTASDASALFFWGRALPFEVLPIAYFGLGLSLIASAMVLLKNRHALPTLLAAALSSFLVLASVLTMPNEIVMVFAICGNLIVMGASAWYARAMSELFLLT